MGNWDYVLNPMNTLSGRYFYATDPSVGDFPTTAALPGLTFTTRYTNQVAALKLTSIVSNSFVNEARISYQRNVSQLAQSSIFTDPQVGIAPLATGDPILSLITVGGAFTVGNFIYNFYEGANQFQWADQISWTHGKQTVRAGFEAERIQSDIRKSQALLSENRRSDPFQTS